MYMGKKVLEAKRKKLIFYVMKITGSDLVSG